MDLTDRTSAELFLLCIEWYDVCCSTMHPAMALDVVNATLNECAYHDDPLLTLCLKLHTSERLAWEMHRTNLALDFFERLMTSSDAQKIRVLKSIR